MATAAAIARTRRLLDASPVLRQWQGEVTNQADLLLRLPTLRPGWVHDPRETAAAPLPRVRAPRTTDGPATWLDIARLFCLRIQTLGITWLLTGDARYRDRAKAELLAVCSFPSWEGDKFLVTAETAFGAAVGYDWLHDTLSPEERDEVARAIVEKAIAPGLAQFAQPQRPYWTRTAMNWNLVCNGALMIAALAIWEREAKAALLFSLCRASIAIGFAGYSPDGGWAEGPGYWHYATQYAIYLLDCLGTALGTALGLDASQGLARTGRFRLHVAGPTGKLFNFGDSAEEHSGGYWLFWLARRYRHPLDARVEEQRGKVHPMDLLWFDGSGRGPERLPTGSCFRGVDVVTLRGDWRDRATTYLGIKAGVNGVCEHGHYDLGSFILDAAGCRWAIDLGPDDYALADYFETAMRRRYYRTSTLGHNTIVIAGQSQPADARSAILATRFGRRASLAVIDLTAAYPGAARAWRGFALFDRRHVVVVDEILPAAAIETVDWQLHTRATVETAGAAAVLAQEPLRFHLRIVEPEGRAWSTASATPVEPGGQDANVGVTKLVLRCRAVSEPLRLSVLLSPDAEAAVPPALRRPLAEWLDRPPGRRPEAGAARLKL